MTKEEASQLSDRKLLEQILMEIQELRDNQSKFREIVLEEVKKESKAMKRRTMRPTHKI